ncbi:MAG TPA: TonB-dependent receptor [Bryobacteraceae bacterium]|nr:TonB-dependent receptor [Bryobacteraceae bacterium]
MLRLCLLACVAVSSVMAASEYRGQVSFGKVPVPGALITVARGAQKFTVISDARGFYQFKDLSDGTWSVEIQMTCFRTIKEDVVISSATAPGDWQLHLLPLDQVQFDQTQATVLPHDQVQAAPSSSGAKPNPSEGLLINGSTNNGAASIFGQAAGFGNNRSNGRRLYNGGLGMVLDNSTLDAKPYSLTGQDIAKPSYNRLEGLLSLGGPLRIPHVLKRGPDFALNYQWTRGKNVTTQPALVPTAAQRSGAASQIPESRISPQATALLGLYPLPNFASGTGYNYQTPLTSNTHQDALQMRASETLGRRDQIFGNFALQSIRMDASTLFRFLDVTDSLGLAAKANWAHEFSERLYLKLGYQFSRYSVQVKPYFADRENISGLAGISGNNQEPVNWGPPTLTFASGIASLSDVQSSDNHNQTDGLSYAMFVNHQNHNFLLGGDLRREQFNVLSQQDPRGTFTFTGAATGSDFGDFLLGIPDTSSIAFGNADKYFRGSIYDVYVTDDWRIGPALTVNAGLRWDYGAPITELYNRLVNLDLGAGFSAAAPVVASDPVGAITGQGYPHSLLQPDKSGFEPRIGVAWRQLSGSSLVIRAGYGIYYNTSVYQSIALQMGQQPPLSKTVRVQNSSNNPLTLANGFLSPAGVTANTFAVDPNFQVGYAQNWQFSVQRDLPGSLQMTATYLGIKGTHATQDFLPNTYPVGSVNPCPACPAGFSYLTSNANSSREAGTIQLRRRLHRGLTATLQYTFSKSIDDAAVLGGGGGSQANAQSNANSGGSQSAATSAANPLTFAVAQNWLDLGAERGLSSFDQRHLLNVAFQYTTGMGLRGGTLLSGWRGALFKEWTFGTDITASSGLPLTPVYLVAVPGTGVTGTIRPDYTGAPLYDAPVGGYLNPGAYAAPLAGQWGNAGRNTIEGPSQFSLNASLGRTFRLTDHFNLDMRLDATNALNHVNYTTWGTTINSPQFGLPVAANAMRSVQTTVRLRF